MLALQPSLAIRPAREEDLVEIGRLEEAAFVDSWPPPMISHELTHPRALLLVASWGEGGPLVSYISFRHGGGESELLRLAVDPEERRRGVGRTVVHHGFELLRSVGVESCHLEVRMDNEGAIAFYRDLGFERSGRRRSYYRDGSDALVFSRPL